MHPWNLTPKEAIALQQELRQQVRIEPLTTAHSVIGGCDVSMNRFAKEGYAGFVSLDPHTLAVTDHSVVKSDIPFPYVPGLLSFREIPMLLRAWEKLSNKPDVLLVDGIGIAHPRRFGIASHLGVLLDIPTIGCAKSVLIGSYQQPPDEPGSFSDLIDKNGEVIGAAVRTKKRTKPIFVSAGHRITLAETVAIVLTATKGYRLPEPTRQAHLVVNEYRMRDLEASSNLH